MAPAVAAGGEPPQDALQYVRAVKTRFIRTSPQTYEQFLEVMRDFKNARCVRKASRLPLAFLVLKFHARFRPPPPALLTPPTLNPQVRHRRGREAREKPARGTPRPAGRLQLLPPRGTRALETPRRRPVRLTRGFPIRPVRRRRPRRARPARGAVFVTARARRSCGRNARLDRDDRASPARKNARAARILPRSAGFFIAVAITLSASPTHPPQPYKFSAEQHVKEEEQKVRRRPARPRASRDSRDRPFFFARRARRGSPPAARERAPRGSLKRNKAEAPVASFFPRFSDSTLRTAAGPERRGRGSRRETRAARHGPPS